MGYTREQIEKAVKAKGYVWFEGSRDYDLNIIGIRNSSTGKKVTNLFDDWITLSYRIKGEWKFHFWPATTEPGKKGMLEGKAKGGVARLMEGQYRGSHGIGLHQGKYEALTQKGKLRVYRDGDRDLEFDDLTIDEGSGFGINIHMAGDDSIYVENWSEGCQVFKRKKDFREFMAICNKAKEIYGNSFTYTLIDSADII
jgi:hypothetical protein